MRLRTRVRFPPPPSLPRRLRRWRSLHGGNGRFRPCIPFPAVRTRGAAVCRARTCRSRRRMRECRTWHWRSCPGGLSHRNSPAGWPRRRRNWSAPTVIVAGHITVEPQQRESYLAGCVASSNRLAGRLAASTSRSARSWSTPAVSTSSSAGSRRRRWRPPQQRPRHRAAPGDAHGVRSGVRHRRCAAPCSGGGRVN